MQTVSLMGITLTLLCMQMYAFVDAQTCLSPELSVCTCDLTSVDCRYVDLPSIYQIFPNESISIFLFNTNITEIPPGSFIGMTSLQRLDLGSNLITIINSGAFAGLLTLFHLDLAYNPITSIAPDAFVDLVKLIHLDLRSALLTTLPETLFSSNTLLNDVYIQNNNIEALPANLFTPVIFLAVIRVEENPTKCCLMQGFVQNLIHLHDPVVATLQCTDFVAPNASFESASAYNEFDFSLCPVDGQWSEWQNSSCSVTCGSGVITRNRSCDNPPPTGGGADCNGTFTDTVSCVLDPCPPVDGQWSEWQNSSCSVTCGSGVITRNRSCDNPSPAEGGADCNGTSTDTVSCVLDPCPPVDGQWSEWQNSSCSVTCGSGVVTRNRSCDNPPPTEGGAECNGSSSDTVSCVLDPCPPTAVDGQWGEWQNSSCSVTCGSGMLTRNRSCDNPSPAEGGAECNGSSTEIEACMLDPCPYCPPNIIHQTIKDLCVTLTEAQDGFLDRTHGPRRRRRASNNAQRRNKGKGKNKKGKGKNNKGKGKRNKGKGSNESGGKSDSSNDSSDENNCNCPDTDGLLNIVQDMIDACSDVVGEI